MKLEEIRKRIDKIDNEILSLLNQRAEEVRGIVHLKEKRNLNIFSPEREASILRRLNKLNKGPLKKEDIEIVFKEILSVCRAIKVTLNIGYLGPEGTFTHLAAVKKFGKKANFVPCDSIREVFESVEKHHLDYGVVPIENSIEGVVSYTLDMFFESDLKICAEITLEIEHSLLVSRENKGKIERIYSNPQVFAQCREWLFKNYSQVELVPCASTAKAAQLARKHPQSGCIGSKILADLYKLKVVASEIEDKGPNVTRFLVISLTDSVPSGDDKTSVLFSIRDKVGALYEVLSSFKKWGINLTKIESRPSKRKPWEYYFFVDFCNHRQEENVKKVLKELEKSCIFLKILGSYPRES